MSVKSVWALVKCRLSRGSISTLLMSVHAGRYWVLLWRLLRCGLLRLAGGGHENSRQKSTHTTVRAQWRKPLATATASVAAIALGAVGLSGPLAPASAAQSDDSEAEGRLLTGGGVVNLNDIAEIAGAYSANPSAPGEVDHPLSLEVLGALDIDLGDGLQLFGENGVIGVGALGQYASTSDGEVPL